jgi:hypothetical protein
MQDKEKEIVFLEHGVILVRNFLSVDEQKELFRETCASINGLKQVNVRNVETYSPMLFCGWPVNLFECFGIFLLKFLLCVFPFLIYFSKSFKNCLFQYPLFMSLFKETVFGYVPIPSISDYSSKNQVHNFTLNALKFSST